MVGMVFVGVAAAVLAVVVAGRVGGGALGRVGSGWAASKSSLETVMANLFEMSSATASLQSLSLGSSSP